MRSDGIVLKEPLRKDGCSNCGALIGRNIDPGLPYRRTDGTSPRELQRHSLIASGILTEIERLNPKGPVLEVGAASFQTALSLARALPEWDISAMEPSPERIPNTNDIRIFLTSLDEASFDRPFGLIYANHVLEHVPHPNEFLKKLAGILAPDGIVLLSCPDALIPSHELLFSDHLYHFTPAAIAAVAEGTGIWLQESKPTPWEPLSQLFILKKNRALEPANQKDLTPERLSYFSRWVNAEVRLLSQLGDAPVLFGAGEFSQLIQTYLPKVWALIDCVIVDDLRGVREFGKPVWHAKDLDLRGRVVLLGVHPYSTARLSQRLSFQGARLVLSIFD